MFSSQRAHSSCLLSKCPFLFSSSDVDECVTNSHNCDDNATCINTVGGFHCMCNMGYTGVGTEGNCTSKVQNLNSVIHPAVISAQLMRPGIGQSISSAVDHFA